MNKNIIIILISVVIGIIIGMNVMCAELSPQHAEFLRVFFVELPKTLFERCFSAFL